MTDYGHDLQFGTFLTPANSDPDRVLALARLTEEAGLDLATFQDHPYQSSHLDTWTLMTAVAAQTSTLRVSGNVLNLPLRPPAVLARAAASLDLISHGRVELGLGAGGFSDAIAAMGGPRRTAGESVEALEEAIKIIREIWDTDQRGGVRLAGKHYTVEGAKRGPKPAHDIGIWLGAYKPRMLRLVGRSADGWLPSLSYLQPGDLTTGNKIIDESALAAGRQPDEIRRLLNVGPEMSAEQLAELALTEGISTFIAAADDPALIRRFGTEIAPKVRGLVAEARAAEGQPGTFAAGPESPLANDEKQSITVADDQREHEWDRLGCRPTPDPGVRLVADQPWDESIRPKRVASKQAEYSARGKAVGKHLIDVHDHLRSELETVRDVLSQVRQGSMEAGVARSTINELTMRQNNWTLGTYCESYCTVVAQHHGMEDDAIFPHLRAADNDLGPVLDRLIEEHGVIHEVLELIDRRLVEFIAHPADFSGLQNAVDLLTDTLLSHLSYEEDQLLEPLARLGFFSNQV